MTQQESGDAVGGSADTPTARTSGLLGLVVAVALGVWVLDQAAKWWAVVRLENQDPISVVGSWLTLSFLRNPGAAFSLGSGSTVLFTAVAAVVVVVILRSARRLRSAWWAVALGGLLGGAIGNLTDRLLRDPGFPSGHVVDFISVKYFAVFNVADMAIVGSAILMVLLSLLGVEFSGTDPDRAGGLEGPEGPDGRDAEPAAGSGR